ncbi:MAG: hypothetical protein E6Z01_08735 [Actinomyces sp.]|nr:hypothetical protein [Actinomyces sp.]
MANLTITVDEETLRRARIRAIQEGTSVNHYLAQQLSEYARDKELEERRRQAIEDFIELARQNPGHSGGRGWTREELYENARGGLRP